MKIIASRFTTTLAALVIAAAGLGQTAQQPTQTPPAQPSPAEQILKQTQDAYANARSYQGDWTYTLQRGPTTRKMLMEIRAKDKTKLSFRLALAPGEKQDSRDPIPEMLVVIDGKTAYFQNTTDNVYFKVALPPKAIVSPIMFVPQVPRAGELKRADDVTVDGKAYTVVQAPTLDGGVSRMEIDPTTSRIHRIVTESPFALAKVESTITVTKETVDGEVPDSVFTYHAPRGAKEIPAPPDAAALFGPK